MTKNQSSTVLVTGAAGYVGSVLCEELLRNDYRVIALDNQKQGHRQAVPPGATFIAVDLAEREALERVFLTRAPDAVMHLAASSVVSESVAQPGEYFRNNVANSINLLDAMMAHGVKRIVFASSAAVYGEPVSYSVSERDPAHPTNPYGESKLMFERVLQWYGRAHELRSVSLRCFNAAGATPRFGEDHHPETHLIPNMMKVALKQEEQLNVYGTDYDTKDGTCVRDYIHVLDIARAHILALRALDGGASISPIYNLGNGEGYSVFDVLNAAREVTGGEIPMVVQPRRPGDPPKLVAGAKLIRKELGWQPQFRGLNDIIASAWEWHREHPNGYGQGSV
ncbi:MAG: UDP-glucose 4-epimerase GalE [Chloroflexi bacterium]|nr:UDP-glucose 4-epimerase GalE [Chloroflexota bacterium]